MQSLWTKKDMVSSSKIEDASLSYPNQPHSNFVLQHLLLLQSSKLRSFNLRILALLLLPATFRLRTKGTLARKRRYVFEGTTGCERLVRNVWITWPASGGVILGRSVNECRVVNEESCG